jgi:hypothetical protein
MSCINSDINSGCCTIEEDDLAAFDSGCSLREQAHENEFDQVKSNLHKAAEWEIAKSDNGMGSLRYSKDTTLSAPHFPTSPKAETQILLFSNGYQTIREHLVEDMIGHLQAFNSPLEWRAGSPLKVPLVYCDFTASSRPLRSIEEYLHRTCLPFYGNTHTNTSITGSQSSAFVSEARQIIAEACNAKITGKASQDVVFFAYVFCLYFGG